jgi:GNAT superfamily N-acetyltransferase
MVAVNEVTVRRIRPDDAERLRSVRLAALVDTPAAFARTYEEESPHPPELWSERASMGSAGDAVATYFAETASAEVVGLVAGIADEDCVGVVELVSMWVAPEARGTGVAVALVDAVVAWARASAGHSVELWVMRENTSAERFYERYGFVELDDFRASPSDPCRNERRMRLDL